MEHPKQGRNLPLFQTITGDHISDPKSWLLRWRRTPYSIPPHGTTILECLKKQGVDSEYIEWLLRPEYLKLSRVLPSSSLPEEAQADIVRLFEDLEGLEQRLRDLVKKGYLPGRPVESHRRWRISFEKEITPVCHALGIQAMVMGEFRKKRPRSFRGRPQEERVRLAFLISEEFRRTLKTPAWNRVSDLLAVRFPQDKAWCTVNHVSRAVAQFKNRVEEREAKGIVKAYRQWFKTPSLPLGSVSRGSGPLSR